MSKSLIVAIDGPAGSGKSTSSKLVAQKLGYKYVDTGAMYRAITLLAVRKNLLFDRDAIVKLANEAKIDLVFSDSVTNVKVNGEDVTEAIRSPEISVNVSDISKIEGVRKVLVEKQRQLCNLDEGIVIEGRDIATVVFPEADVKIFLTASVDQRAKRRAKELIESGTVVSVDEIKDALVNRDLKDSTREISPLTKAPDAVEVDTSVVSINEQVEIILNRVRKIAKEKGIEIPY